MNTISDQTLSSAAVTMAVPHKHWLSLILATVGRSDQLKVVLDSLLAQSEQGFEVIVVDQNPDDRLIPVLAAFEALNIVHLRLEKPNLSLARNSGLIAATGAWVAFPDDDCWYEADCLAKIRTTMLADAQLDGVVARWVEFAPDAQPTAHHLDRQAWRDFRGGDASSITLFLSREAVSDLQGFDPQIGVGQYYGAGEETDLLLRMLDRQCSLLFLPDARVHHHFSLAAPDVTAATWKALRARSRGVGAIYAKHRLSAKVVVRGLVAPLLHPIRSSRPINDFALGVAAVLGRLEGMMRWWWRGIR